MIIDDDIVGGSEDSIFYTDTEEFEKKHLQVIKN